MATPRTQADSQENQGTLGGQTSKLQFKRVSKSFKVAGGARRGKAKIAVGPTGICRTNSAAKEITLKFIRDRGGDPNNFELTFGGSEELGQMAIYFPQPDEPGAMQVTQWKNALTFHCGAVFEDNPLLRPSSTVDCSITPGADANGEPCLLVNISGGSPSRTVKRPKKDQAPPTPDPNANVSTATAAK